MEYSRTVHQTPAGVSMNVEVNKGNEFYGSGDGLCYIDAKSGPEEISFMAVRFSSLKDGARLRLEFNADHQLSEYSFLDTPCPGGTLHPSRDCDWSWLIQSTVHEEFHILFRILA